MINDLYNVDKEMANDCLILHLHVAMFCLPYICFQMFHT